MKYIITKKGESFLFGKEKDKLVEMGMIEPLNIPTDEEIVKKFKDWEKGMQSVSRIPTQKDQDFRLIQFANFMLKHLNLDSDE